MLKHRLVLALALALSLAVAGPAATEAAAVTDGECVRNVEVVIWTANRHRDLMRALAANPAPCTEYWISIPAEDGDKTMPRAAAVYRQIRNLGPNFHPLAEVVLAGTGWARWVAAGNGTWYEAGVEMRRRITFLEPDLGETWLLNEFDRTTRVDGARTQAEIDRGLTVPYTRAAMKELVRGLYEGAPGMEPLPGAVEIGVAFGHQNLPDVPGYKAQLKPYLQDADFWSFMRGKVRWLLHEAYADTRNHGVPGSTLEERRSHLEDYVFHLRELARAGGRHTTTVDRFLRRRVRAVHQRRRLRRSGRRCVRLRQRAREHRGSGRSDDEVRHRADLRGAALCGDARGEPLAKKIGFSWQPVNRFGLPGPQFEAEVELQAARLAEAFRWAYGPGSTPEGACVVPGTVVDWCTVGAGGSALRGDLAGVQVLEVARWARARRSSALPATSASPPSRAIRASLAPAPVATASTRRSAPRWASAIRASGSGASV